MRFNCLLSGKVRLKDRTIENAEVKNFSRRGFRLVLSDANGILKGRVEVRLDIPGKILPAYVSGEVIWNQKINNHSEIGIKINKMHSLHKSEVFDYIYSVWRNKLCQRNNSSINNTKIH